MSSHRRSLESASQDLSRELGVEAEKEGSGRGGGDVDGAEKDRGVGNNSHIAEEVSLLIYAT